MIREAVLKTIRQNNGLAEVKTVIVAVSGGCDSVALLHVMKCLQACLGIDLHIASLNHGIRGEAGQRDLDFVVELAERWCLPITTGRADVPALMHEWGIGIEEAARRARYNFLAEVAQEQGSNCVAVGHHLLDQAETILMHILRGSGTRGLRGMQVVAQMPYHPQIRLIRPLLSVSRDELGAYCRRHALQFRSDDSNDDISYHRNFVRHEVISRLKQLNPDVLDAFARLADSAGMDEDFIASQFESVVKPVVRVTADSWRIGKETFSELHPALQRRFIREAYRQLSDGSSSLSHALTQELIAGSMTISVGGRRDLGASVQLRIDYDDLYIERAGSHLDTGSYRLIPSDTDIRVGMDVPLEAYGIKISFSSQPQSRTSGFKLMLPVDAELRLRTRRKGERFKPKGMGGQSRKIKDWMIDRKIPRAIRDRVPLICADDKIIAICLGDTWHLADLSHVVSKDRSTATLLLE